VIFTLQLVIAKKLIDPFRQLNFSANSQFNKAIIVDFIFFIILLSLSEKQQN
jgi:hypothetical protein